jgi:RNA polymerase sigma factor (sigma-70 family)
VSRDASEFRFSLDEIRAHTAWCKRLASALVGPEGGGAAADDAVQELWLAGVAHPPPRGEGIRAWLRVVLANVVRKQRRGDSRRRAREEVAATTAQVTTPWVSDGEDLALRLEAQRLVAELVLGLEEPLRTTLLLRYYEDFSPAQIAARLGIPAGTVRWRLKQARDQLRARLDARHGGGHAWRALLLPLTPPAQTPLRRLEIWKGVLAMKTGTKLGALAVVLLLALFGGVTRPRWRAQADASARTTAVTSTTPIAAVGGPAVEAAAPGARTSSPGSPSGARPRVHVPRFVTAASPAADAPAVTGSRLLAQDHGHLANRFPDGGGPTPVQVARTEDKLDQMRERANHCLAGWQRLDPALSEGIMLEVMFDADGLEDVWVDGQPTIPDGPLRCLSNAVYEIDWSGLVKNKGRITMPLRYETPDAGTAP